MSHLKSERFSKSENFVRSSSLKIMRFMSKILGIRGNDLHFFELMFCWMFFQRKELRQNGRRLIPDCCFDYIKRLEDPWVDYDGDEESESSNGSDDEVDRFEFEDLESSSELSMLASMSNSVGII